MRFLLDALCRYVCVCAVASNPFLHVAGISWSLGGSLVAEGGLQGLSDVAASTIGNDVVIIVQGIRS